MSFNLGWGISMRKILLAAALVAAGTFGAHAADLMVAPEEPMMAPMVSSTSIYVQLLGGVAAGLDSKFYENDVLDEEYSMDAGAALAATLGVMVMDNVAIEGDLLWTDRAFTDNADDISSISAMINAKAFLPINEMFTVYGAAGVGFIKYAINPNDGNYSGFGYQLIAGASAQVADNIAVVGEARYQSTFSAAESDDNDGWSLEAPTLSLLAGVKIDF